MSNPVINEFGNKIWYNEQGEFHREDGPAVEFVSGTKHWYRDGKRHRDDGPAVELANGTKYWYLNGERHREDGPAIEYANGIRAWYYQGKWIDCQDQETFERLIKLKAFW